MATMDLWQTGELAVTPERVKSEDVDLLGPVAVVIEVGNRKVLRMTPAKARDLAAALDRVALFAETELQESQ